MSRLAKLLALGAAAVLSVPVPGGPDASARGRAAASGWTAHIFVHGPFSGLAAGPGGLYTAEGRSGTSTIVRVSPLTGRVLARSSALKDFGGFSLIGGKVWAFSNVGDVGHRRSPELLALNVGSLKQVRVMALKVGPAGRTAATAGGPAVAPAGTAWAALGCQLVHLDLSSGRLLRSVQLGTEAGCGSQIAVEGSRLYVAAPEGLGGSIRLQERQARTGALLGVSDVPDPPLGVALAISGNYLWAVGGDMGTAGDLYLYSASTLRLLGASGVEGGGGPVPGGPGVVRLPATSEFPAVDVSAGVVWVGTQGGDAGCFDARTAKWEATGLPRPDIVTGNVVVTALGTFATGYSPASGASGIVKVVPPVACQAGG